MSRRRAEPGRVVIVGAGYSGLALALELLARTDRAVTLVDGAAPARGVAYATREPAHLLNVRTANMGALADRPGHFGEWLAAHTAAGPPSFAPRYVYGDYLAALLDQARAAHPDRLRLHAATAVDVGPDAVHLADSTELAAAHIVLAWGNLPPAVPPGLDPTALGADCYRADPWRATLSDGLDANDHVLLLGTGLTSVDAALLLNAHGFAGRITMISRHGLLPRRHEPTPAAVAPVALPSADPLALLRHVRARAETVGWRNAVDALRPHTQALWQASDMVGRRRFLRHLRTWWDVHRHRLAPEAWDRIAALRASGRLDVVAGKLTGFVPDGKGVRVAWRPRGTDRTATIHARRVVNGTGPLCDITASDDPLVRRLLAAGTIRPDPLRLGLDVTPAGAVIAADGIARERLWALGPPTRGALWECTAVPDIRRAAADLATRLGSLG